MASFLRNNIYSLTLALTILSLAQTNIAVADINFSHSGQWNYKKVYLSPARHSNAGSRGECNTYEFIDYNRYRANENTQALYYAVVAANGDQIGNYQSSSTSRNLRVRGYKVRIGLGSVTSAVNNSNSWNANVHIPIHSNARTEQCSNSDNSKHGTVIIYKSNNGKKLAEDIKSKYSGNSPGTNDFVCHNSSNCTAFNCLAELCNTNAVAAYLEREYHTWNKGILHLSHPESKKISWKLGWAIDQYLGWP